MKVLLPHLEVEVSGLSHWVSGLSPWAAQGVELEPAEPLWPAVTKAAKSCGYVPGRPGSLVGTARTGEDVESVSGETDE